MCTRVQALVTLASNGDVRVAVVSLGAVARKASIDLLSAVAVVALAKAACDVQRALP